LAFGGPAAGADRRAVLKVAAIMMGACDKDLQAAYERKRRPPQMQYQPWIDDCVAQVTNAIMAVDAMMDADQPYLLLGRLAQADVTAFITERHARLGIDTDTQAPRLRTLARKLAEEAPFRSTEA
jgi:glutathione S-transferase